MPPMQLLPLAKLFNSVDVGNGSVPNNVHVELIERVTFSGPTAEKTEEVLIDMINTCAQWKGKFDFHKKQKKTKQNN